MFATGMFGLVRSTIVPPARCPFRTMFDTGVHGLVCFAIVFFLLFYLLCHLRVACLESPQSSCVIKVLTHGVTLRRCSMAMASASLSLA
jgi:hypothetical protein